MNNGFGLSLKISSLIKLYNNIYQVTNYIILYCITKKLNKHALLVEIYVYIYIQS